MELIAAGRDADVFALDDERVLRRYRRPVDTADEARITTYLYDHGYPVPRVYDAAGSDMVLERLHGPLMFDVMVAKPWRLGRLIGSLTELQDRLHTFPAPSWLTTSLRGLPLGKAAAGLRVLHLDMHPFNVVLSERGPVVIDWTNAAAGDPAVDDAFTYLTLGGAKIPATGPRRLLAEAFRVALLRSLRSRWSDGVREALPRAVEIRTTDPNLSSSEAARMSRVAAHVR